MQRRASGSGRFFVMAIGMGLAGAVHTASAQNPGSQFPVQSSPSRNGNITGQSADDNADTAMRKGIAERQEKSRNEDRQKRLVADTEKLLALATQLHTDVAKTDKNILSLDVVKRAQEIEKLAHEVKERMRS